MTSASLWGDKHLQRAMCPSSGGLAVSYNDTGCLAIRPGGENPPSSLSADLSTAGVHLKQSERTCEEHPAYRSSKV